jgi:hypothetical protein
MKKASKVNNEKEKAINLQKDSFCRCRRRRRQNERQRQTRCSLESDLN